MPLPRPKPLRAKKPKRAKATKWVWLLELKEIEGDWCYGEILNLPGWKTIKYKETGHDVIVLAEATSEITGFCKCGAPTSELLKWGFSDPCYVHDIPIRSKRVRVYFRYQRIRCRLCKNSIQQPVMNIDERHAMTTRLVTYIEQESFDIRRNFSEVADEVGRSEQTIRNVFTRRGLQLEKETKKLIEEGRFETPEWIAIDEVHPKKKREEYCVITAPEWGKVLDVFPVNKKMNLLKWLLQLPNRQAVKMVSIDMDPEYRVAVKRLLKADIVVDRYHVHNLLNVAIKQVLDVMRDSMTDSEIREYMRPEHLLLKSYRCISDDEEAAEGKEDLSPKEVVDKWLENMPDVALAHQLKEAFSDILQLTNRQKAEEMTDLWLEQACEFVKYFSNKYENKYRGNWENPFGNVVNTICAWRPNILNYIDWKFKFKFPTVSNGFAEFANDRIRKAYQIGRYSDEVLRLKVVYGGVLVRRRPPHPINEQRIPAKRESAADKDKIKPLEKNLSANLEMLKKAREDADRTKDLLPSPQENSRWKSRFDGVDFSKVNSGVKEQVTDEDIKKETQTETKETDQNSKGTHRPLRFDPNQLKLFV